MVPSLFSNFNFQRCRYQVKLSVNDIMLDLYGEKSKMNVRSILIFDSGIALTRVLPRTGIMCSDYHKVGRNT